MAEIVTRRSVDLDERQRLILAGALEQRDFDIEPCPECGAGDAEYGQHEPGCPSGYPTRPLTESEKRLMDGNR